MRVLIAIAGALLLLVGAVVWLTLQPKPVGSSEWIALEADPAEPPADEPASELADPDEPVVEPASSGGGDEARVALATEAPPPAADTVDRARKTAPFAFVVVDERSGLRLPRYLVRLADEAGRKVEIVTDDRGEGRVEELAIGRVAAAALDHPGRREAPQKREIEHVAGLAPAHEVLVASGATYQLELVPVQGLDPGLVEVRITLESAEGDSGSSSFEPVRAAEPYRRGDELVWVRLPARDPSLDRARRLEARTRDGLWTGSAPATVVKGQASGAVRIELSPRGVVTGRVTSAGTPAAGVNVTFREDSGPGEKRRFSASTRTDGEGRYRIEYAQPCRAKLSVASIPYALATRDVTLAAGETRKEDFELTALPTVGRIAGTIVSESGTYETKLEVTLKRAVKSRTELPEMRARVRWKTVEGRRVGEFDFGLLPGGRYRLDCGRPDWLEWTPRTLEVEAPKEDVLVRVADTALRADFAFQIHDADNGLTLNRAHLVLETLDGEKMKWVDSGEVVLRGYPEERRLRWRLDKAGYPSRTGDMSSFDVTTLVDGRRVRTCELNLQPGWSEVIRVTQGKDEKPLAGVLVKLDGVEAGKTDAKGLLRVSAREKPRAITVELAGWRLDGGVDLRSPRERNWRRYVEVHLRATKKK